MPRNEGISTTPRALLIAPAFLAAFAFQGSRGLYETSEGCYAECAREMIESGNYLEPTLGYRPHWTKPPMTYWAIAAGIRLAGLKAAAGFYRSPNDMRRLYETCRKVNGDRACFAVFDRSKLYGLQFYLSGRLRRVSLESGRPWADATVDETLRAIKGSDSPGSYVLISDRKKERLLSVQLEKSGLCFRRLSDRFRILYVIAPPGMGPGRNRG